MTVRAEFRMQPLVGDMDAEPTCTWVVGPGGEECAQSATWSARCRKCGAQAGLICDRHRDHCRTLARMFRGDCGFEVPASEMFTWTAL